ncbi:macrophage colony-stimulating factor 1 isoform X4 [Loxodonta africana]|uniref:macrophage colony-stimulating factor 1 isoform X4 n=1 Tax=Loxodonta africana TaxID=9785 RepID=UPI0030D44D2B
MAVRKSQQSCIWGPLHPGVRDRVCRTVGIKSLFFCPQQGLGASGESKSWEEMTPSLSQTWLGPRLLLTCLLVSTSVTEAVPEYCSHLIRDGHLTILQQLNDRVCYLKKAFLLVQDIMEDTLRFKDNTPNANATMQLQELSIRLKSCFTKDDEEQDKACVRTFTETPLQLLEKIKNVFNETKNLLTNDWKVFSKNCSDSFAKCSSHDVVTKPDCNCLYPKATPSSDLASVSLRQPLTPSAVPLAGLTGADSEGTEDGSFLPSEQPLHAVDPGSAKQRPSRSTCQNFESPETPGVEGIPTSGSPQLHPSVGAPTPGMEDVLDSVLGTDWALEEASGEASEGSIPQGSELSPSRLGGSSIQAETTGPSNLFSASSPVARSTAGQKPAHISGTPLPGVGPVQPMGQAWNHIPEKPDSLLALPRDHQEPSTPRTPSLRPQGLSSSSTLSVQPRLPRSHSGGSVLPLRELEGKRSTRDRRSPTELEGGPASEGAARPQARFNPVPLTDTGHGRQHVQHSDPQLPGFVFHLLVPSIILVLLAVGGLLFYRWKRRSHRELQTVDSPMEQPEDSWAHRTVSPWEEKLWGHPPPSLPSHSPGMVACPL